MLIQLDNHIKKLDEYRAGTLKTGLRLGIPRLDEHFRFKYGDFNIILGHANVGKTSLVLYLMTLYAMKHGIKWLVFSSENEPYSIIRKIVEFREGKPINKIEETHYKEQVKWINEHFKFIDGSKLYTYKSLLDLAQHVKKAWDYQGFLLDPYNSLNKDKDVLKGISGHEYDYQATSEIRIFCKENNISTWVCTHAATQSLRERHHKGHFYEGHPIPPSAASVEGGGKFVNRCDNFLVIHRYIYHPADWMYSHLHIKKIKDVDTGGRPTPMEDPIRLESVINNVGFTIEGKNPIQYPKREQIELL
jgi:hypothetical protein